MAEELNLDELKRLAEAATPGPWYQIGIPWSDGSFIKTCSDPHGGEYVCSYDGMIDLESDDVVQDWHVNLAYIAAANPETMLRLIAAIKTERARAEAAERRVAELEAMLYVPESIADEAARLADSLRTEIRYACGDEGGGYYFDCDAEGLVAEALHAVQRQAAERVGREARRETLLEAASAMCEWCAAGRPVEWHAGMEIYHHPATAQQSGCGCRADEIRSLIAAEAAT